MTKLDPLQAPAHEAHGAHVALQREVARLHQSEQSLREENEDLLENQRLLEEARDDFVELYDEALLPLLTLGPQGTIRSANLATAELFERERSWLVGRSFRMLFQVLDRSRVADCLSAGATIKECRALLALADDVLVPVQVARRFSLRKVGVSHVALIDLRMRDGARNRHASEQDYAPSRRRILLVEDQVDTAEAMQEVLERNGYRVVSADSVETAVDVDLARVDAIVSDIRLPDGSGNDLLRQLRKARNVPAIAFSGLTAHADIESAKSAGFDGYFTKPVDFPRMLASLATLLKPRPPETSVVT